MTENPKSDIVELGSFESKVIHLIQNPIKDRFASWFYIGPVSKFDKKPQRINILGQEVTVFKKAHNSFAALYGYCIHQGADLSNGSIVNGHLRCPFHNWTYNAEGEIVDVPDSYESVKCQKRKTKSYFVHPHLGHLFIYFGEKPHFLPPIFPELVGKNYITLEALDFYVQGAWYLPAANGFDFPHFEIVHNRRIVAPPKIDIISDHTLRVTHVLENTGSSLADKFIKMFVGKESILEFTVYSGNIILAKVTIGSQTNFMFICSNPLKEGYDSESFIIPIRHLKSPILYKLTFPLQYLLNKVRRKLIRAFFSGETDSLHNVKINPKNLVKEEEPLLDYLIWLSKIQRKYK